LPWSPLKRVGRGAEEVDMAELVVNRWRKYGKDRAYVNTADGVRIGWVDFVSGERVIERPEFEAAFDAALANEGMVPAAPMLTATLPLVAAQPVVTAPPPSVVAELPQPRGPVWVDLAENRPGQAAREQAIVQREAMRERSKAGTFIARLLDVKTDERAWRVGAEGEEAVGAQLAALAKHGWRFLHAVRVGTQGSDIDHVAVGPGGVYTLNTKTHRGHRVTVYERAILVDGFKQPYLRNSRHEAIRAARLLTGACGFAVKVEPLIVVLCDALIVKHQPSDVTVVGRRDIALWLRKRPAFLAASEVEAIWEFARRSTTWQP
jgi:Nuclease-related domain